MSCDFQHDDGAYVLGALSPTDRQEFERHLKDCADCAEAVRRLAGLPGLLARVPVAVLDEPPNDEPVPATLLPSVLRQVRRTQLRRRFVAIGSAAAAAVVVAALFLAGTVGVPWAHPTGPGSSVVAAPRADHPMTGLGQESMRADVGFQSVPWGTKVALVCSYAPPHSRYSVPASTTYALIVRTRDGRSQQVATWRALPGRTMQIAAATAATEADIAAVEVRTGAGRPVLHWTM
ncbi:MAG: hypothetical protein QOK15_2748 [Nocardioidaceae bacterium]|nr:hypothetical protein [Nocardioidaceae bacterium]